MEVFCVPVTRELSLQRSSSTRVKRASNDTYSERNCMQRSSNSRKANDTPQKALLRVAGNGQCADCRAMGPTWASVNLGVCVCIQCAGIHRRLGVHITFVQSITSDYWKPDWVERLRLIGNDVAAHFYEYDPSAQKERFTSSPDTLASGDRMQEAVAKRLESWIRAKYEHRKYARPQFQPPHVLVAQGKDPRSIYGLPPLHASTLPLTHAAHSTLLHMERTQRKTVKKDRGAAPDFADVFAQMAAGTATVTRSSLEPCKVDPFPPESLCPSREKTYLRIRAPRSPGKARIGPCLPAVRETIDEHGVVPVSRSTSSPPRVKNSREYSARPPSSLRGTVPATKTTATSSSHRRHGSKHAEHHKKGYGNMSDVDFGDFDGAFVAMDNAGVEPPRVARHAHAPTTPVRPLSPLSPRSPMSPPRGCSTKEPLLHGQQSRLSHRRCFTC